MKFVIENIWWIGLALGSGGMLLWPMLRRGSSGTQDVSPTEAVMLINRESALVLDVREENEFASGHIPEARNIPLSKLEERAAELRKYQQKTVLVNCQGGVRSAKACVELKKAGLTKLYNLRGGLNAWNEAKLPIAKG